MARPATAAMQAATIAESPSTRNSAPGPAVAALPPSALAHSHIAAPSDTALAAR